MMCSMPLNSATSVPGRIGRNRSASRAVSVRRGSATMIFQFRIALARVFDAAEQDRMRIGGVGADDENQVGLVDIFVAGRRRIGAQRLLVAGHRARHAQARIGIDVVGADQALGELVEDVIVLGQQLAGDVEADAVRAVLADRVGEFARDEIERRVPRRAFARRTTRDAQFRMQRAHLLLHGGPGGQVQRAALGAQAAEVGRMVGVAAHAGDPPALAIDSMMTPQPTPQ